jgi:hypothetical protein
VQFQELVSTHFLPLIKICRNYLAKFMKCGGATGSIPVTRVGKGILWGFVIKRRKPPLFSPALNNPSYAVGTPGVLDNHST